MGFLSLLVDGKPNNEGVNMKLTLEELNERVERSIGGDLCLDGLTSIPEGFNPTVGGSLYLDGLSPIRICMTVHL